MPYGVPLSHGGDNAKNDAKMEACIKAVMSKGTPKLNAILICKAQLFPKK